MSRPLDPFIPASQGLIRSKARRLGRRRGFTSSDVPCIEQELWLHLVAHVDEFDPDSGEWEPWASVVLDRRCISLWRCRNAGMRSPTREECSLDDAVLDADGRVIARHETTPEAAGNTDRLRELERDMADVLARIPDDLRAIALALATGTPHGASVAAGVSRRAMPPAMNQIRDFFRDAGLDQYL
jgi:DNA-directed RNA polymerase specialized sigma24 family protein